MENPLEKPLEKPMNIAILRPNDFQLPRVFVRLRVEEAVAM